MSLLFYEVYIVTYSLILMWRMRKVAGIVMNSMYLPYCVNQPSNDGWWVYVVKLRFRKEIGKNCIANRVVGEWNKLPGKVVDAKTVEF